jgi:hypothetical protein
MMVRKCDNCGVEVGRDSIVVGTGFFQANVELCKPCAAPVVQLLLEMGLLQNAMQRNGLIDTPAEATATS